MTKICHITTVHEPFDTRIFHKEARSLAMAGYRVILIAPHKKNEIIDNIKIITLPKPKNRFSRMFFLVREAYKKALKEKAQVYHFHDPEFLRFALKLKKKTGAKIIYDVHEDVPSQILSKKWIPKLARIPISKIFNLYEKNKAKKIDFLIATTSKIKEKFEKVGIRNIEIIENYPIINYFDKGVQKNKQERQKFNLIYAGGITKARGIKEIIKSLEFVKSDIVLTLAGKFQEKGLEKELKKMPGWKKVAFKGWLSQKETYNLMQQSDIGLLCFLPAPNHVNAIPNKLFEYMAAGIPVIASDFPLWKKIIKESEGGINVDSTKPKEIAKAIEYLITHQDIAKKMGENGRRVVFSKYNWTKESKKLLNIYEKLLKK